MKKRNYRPQESTVKGWKCNKQKVINISVHTADIYRLKNKTIRHLKNNACFWLGFDENYADISYI